MAIGPGGSKDATFGAPFVDVDEWRDVPVRHRYVHGGFEGGDTRFSMYFPPAEQYEGRFFQPVLPMSGIEFAASIGVLYGIAGSIEFAVESGAYLVESNLGRANPFPGEDFTMAGFRASAAVARHSRQLAVEMYGEHRPYGYVYGGSGGAFKTVSCFESTNDVWDGAVPFVMGTPMSMPNVFSVQAQAIRLLAGKFGGIIDAIDPGGSGDMYAGLSVEQRQALAEVTKLGCPPRSWFDVDRVARGYTAVWAVLVDNIVKGDPAYFDDFWTVPGYLGADAPESLAAARVQHKTAITEVLFGEQAAALGLPMPMAMPRGTKANDIPAALRVAEVPDRNILGATVEITTGAAAGLKMYVVGVVDDIVITGVGEAHFEASGNVAAGDDVLIDNSVYLAFQSIHRHQVSPDFPQWDQFVAAGQPIYPQRPKLIGPGMALQGSGSMQSGRFAGKMIVVQALMDEAAFPCQALYYRGLVEEALGSTIDDQFRLWFIDHAMHTSAEPVAGMVMPDTTPSRRTRMISYLGALQQAIRDVAAWVERGIAPPVSTGFHYVDGQVLVPPSAKDRRGIQPVVELTTTQGARFHAAVGEDVDFVATVEVPAGGGRIVSAEWDFEGRGDYPVAAAGLDGSADRAVLTATHAFTEPGTYFPVVRVATHRRGDASARHARVQNLARVRVRRRAALTANNVIFKVQRTPRGNHMNVQHRSRHRSRRTALASVGIVAAMLLAVCSSSASKGAATTTTVASSTSAASSSTAASATTVAASTPASSAPASSAPASTTAGTGSTGTSTAPTEAATTTPTTGAPTADTVDQTLTGDAPGVTSDTIKIGVTYVDTEALKAVGLNYDLGPHMKVYQALVDAINAKGGINGRKLQVVFAPIDPTTATSADAACVKLTGDDKVFLITGFFLGDSTMCPLESHSTAVVGGGQTPALTARAKAPWVTWTPDAVQAADVTSQFAKRGLLSGKVAVYYADADKAQYTDDAKPVLDQLGIKPVAVGDNDAPTNDPAASQAKVKVIAEKFKAAHADTILLVGIGVTGWPQYESADKAYRPKLLFTEVLGARSFATSADTKDTSILVNSLSGGGYGPDEARFEEPVMQQCIATLTAAGLDTPAPKTLDPTNASDQPYQAAFQACPDIALTAAVLERAGKNLNYGTLGAAIDGLKITIPGDPTERTYGPPPHSDGDPVAYLYDWDETTKSFPLDKG